MGTYLDIEGDPNEVTGTGAKLRAMAESFQGRAQGILGDIRAVEGERPWGSDQYGQAFETTYNVVPEGGEGTLRDSVQDGMQDAGGRLKRVGENTVLAMTEYQGTDADNAAQIDKTNL
jgi:hypothetical protein